MSNYIIDPNLGFANPTPGVDGGIGIAPTGQDYATLVSNALTAISAHTHTGAPTDGKQISSAGININANLSVNNNDLTNVNALRFTNNSGVLVSSFDVNEFYVVNGNVYFNNAGGTAVQITAGSSLNIAPSIYNLTYSTTSVSANLAILPSQTYSYFNVTSTPIIFTLPSANSVAPGTFYIIKDATGRAAVGNITVNISVGSGNTIDGSTSYIINVNYGCLILITDGISNWNVERIDAVSINGVSITSAANANTVLVGTSSTNAVWSQITDSYVASGAAINVSKLASGTAGQLLVNSATPTPAWVTASADATVSSTGAVAVVGIQSKTLPTLTPGSLQYDGTSMHWSPSLPTPQQIAQLHWHSINRTAKVAAVGIGPSDICFDGANLWVTNFSSNSMTKITAQTGAVAQTVTVGTSPFGCCYDGTNVWTANYGTLTVSKVVASSGTVTNYTIGSHAVNSVTFDGQYIWATSPGASSIIKLDPTSGGVLQTVTVGFGAYDSCFDGKNLWVTNSAVNNVTKILASNGSVVGTYAVGQTPYSICFDGAYVWVANNLDSTISKILASNGSVVGTYATGTNPTSICFDGTNIWVTSTGDNKTTKHLASTGAIITSIVVGTNPGAVCFDGANMWVANASSSTIEML